jgi:hypothetical protein
VTQVPYLRMQSPVTPVPSHLAETPLTVGVPLPLHSADTSTSPSLHVIAAAS